ncbi:MAG: alcohol dehydrogenase catalytic domain-containing protein [Actinobacteria bacterium]|nr:alcohol dehydrogenase catalytic domain-containing protein [Actinomycetota bacterium]
MIGLTKVAPGPGHLELAERPEREPERGEVTIEVHGTGVCGTDLHIASGEYPSRPPITLGHEIAGVVSRLGPDVDPKWEGRQVVCETFFSTCGHCCWCRDGRPNLCPERRSLGTHVDGGFAPRVLVPAANLHPIPAGIGLHAATLAEPLACVCHCMLNPSVAGPGDRVLVVGPGPMGVLAAQVGRALGAKVVVHGLPADALRLEIVRELGFEAVDDSEAYAAADVAIDASGSAAGAGACLAALRRGGRFVQIGIFGKLVSVPLDLVLEKEIEVSTGFASTPRSWRQALGLIARRDVDLEPLVSSVTPLAEWERIFDDLRQSRGMKAVLDPRDG